MMNAGDRCQETGDRGWNTEYGPFDSAQGDKNGGLGKTDISYGDSDRGYGGSEISYGPSDRSYGKY